MSLCGRPASPALTDTECDWWSPFPPVLETEINLAPFCMFTQQKNWLDNGPLNLLVSNQESVQVFRTTNRSGTKLKVNHSHYKNKVVYTGSNT